MWKSATASPADPVNTTAWPRAPPGGPATATRFAEPTPSRLGALFYTAAKLGVDFELKSMRQAITLRNQLEHPQVPALLR